jgi:hypothetical protein
MVLHPGDFMWESLGIHGISWLCSMGFNGIEWGKPSLIIMVNY